MQTIPGMSFRGENSKEIRYADLDTDFFLYLDWILENFPNPYFLFNSYAELTSNPSSIKPFFKKWACLMTAKKSVRFCRRN